MNEFKTAWLNSIYYRDTLYLLLFVAVALGLGWYRFSRGKLYRPLVAVAGMLVVAGLAVGVVSVW